MYEAANEVSRGAIAYSHRSALITISGILLCEISTELSPVSREISFSLKTERRALNIDALLELIFITMDYNREMSAQKT